MRKKIIETMKSNTNLMYLFGFIFSMISLLRIRGYWVNKISIKGSFLYKTKIQVNGRNNTIIIHPENRLNNCLIKVMGSNCNIIVNKHCCLNNLELWIEDDNGFIEIGYRTTIEGGHIAATEGKKITIGEDCMFSHRIEIRNGDSHSILSLDDNRRINIAKDINIGNNVWLGADVKIMKGSMILNNSIVGTGSIVTGFIEANSVYAGVPAKCIKRNIKWERVRI